MRELNLTDAFSLDVFHALHCVVREPLHCYLSFRPLTRPAEHHSESPLARHVSIHYFSWPCTHRYATPHQFLGGWLLIYAEHCLDILRQSIQCYGSTTLIPSQYMDGLQHQYIDSDQVHVCRSFTFLRDFVTAREKGNEAFVERDQSLLDDRKHHDAMEDLKKHQMEELEGKGGEAN